MIRDRGFYRRFFSMWAVLTLQNAVTISVNLVDNLMLGHFSETALAGAAACNQLQFLYQQILLALGESAVIIGTQFFGLGKKAPIRELSRRAMQAAVLVSVLLTAAVSLFPRQLLRIFTDDARIISQGNEYLSVIRFSYLFFAVTVILLATMRIAGIVRIALILSLLALGINTALNYLLIFGNLGFPQMGIRGAALATVISRICELAVLVWYVRCKQSALKLRFRDYLARGGELAAQYRSVLLPLMGVNVLWGLNSVVQTAILGHMSSAAIAANSVASTLFLFVKSTAEGSTMTASFHVGKLIGAGDREGLRRCVSTMQVLFAVIGLVSAAVLFLIRIPVLRVCSLEPETGQLADAFLVILTVVTIGMSYQKCTLAGIIRGGGGIRFAMLTDLISLWGIVIPVSFLAAFVWHASPCTVFWLLNADQLFKCVPAFLKCNFGNWAHSFTGSPDPG